MADLGSARVPTQFRPKFLHVHAILGKIGQIVGPCPLRGLSPPPFFGNSWIRHCILKVINEDSGRFSHFYLPHVVAPVLMVVSGSTQAIQGIAPSSGLIVPFTHCEQLLLIPEPTISSPGSQTAIDQTYIQAANLISEVMWIIIFVNDVQQSEHNTIGKDKVRSIWCDGIKGNNRFFLLLTSDGLHNINSKEYNDIKNLNSNDFKMRFTACVLRETGTFIKKMFILQVVWKIFGMEPVQQISQVVTSIPVPCSEYLSPPTSLHGWHVYRTMLLLTTEVSCLATLPGPHPSQKQD